MSTDKRSTTPRTEAEVWAEAAKQARERARIWALNVADRGDPVWQQRIDELNDFAETCEDNGRATACVAEASAAEPAQCLCCHRPPCKEEDCPIHCPESHAYPQLDGDEQMVHLYDTPETEMRAMRAELAALRAIAGGANHHGAIGLVLHRSGGPDINLDLTVDEAAMLQRALGRVLVVLPQPPREGGR